MVRWADYRQHPVFCQKPKNQPGISTKPHTLAWQRCVRPRLWLKPQAGTGESMLKHAATLEKFDSFGKVELLDKVLQKQSSACNPSRISIHQHSVKELVDVVA